MDLFLKLAFRNLLRNRRRTLITVLSIALGFTAIGWLQAVMEEQSKSIINSIASTYLGHIQIAKRDFRELKNLKNTVSFDSSEFSQFLPEGSHFGKRVYVNVLLASADSSAPTQMQGINIQDQAKSSQVRSTIKEGEYLSSDEDPNCDRKELLISRRLAKNLDVRVNEKLVALAQAADGSTGNDLFKVKGIFDTGSDDFDAMTVFTDMSCAQKIGAVTGIHEWVIQLPSDTFTMPVLKKLRDHFQASKDISVTYWGEVMVRLQTVVGFSESMTRIVAIMLFLVISFGILNTLLISVYERNQEFGTMMALGCFPQQVVVIVFLEVLMIAIMSIFAGMIILAIPISYQHIYGFDTRIIVGKNFMMGPFKPETVIHPTYQYLFIAKLSIFTLFITVLGGVIPSYRVSRSQPMDSIKGR
jgi:putative ABC transport system permease protein